MKNTDGCFSHVLNRTNGTKSRKTSNYIADRDKLLFCEDGEDKLVNKLFFLSCCLAVPQQILSPIEGSASTTQCLSLYHIRFWIEPRPRPSLSQTGQPMGFELATRQFRRNALIHFSSILPFISRQFYHFIPLKTPVFWCFQEGGLYNGNIG